MGSPGIRHPGTGSGANPVADYSLYLVECADGSLYTGISTDVSRRFLEHETGRKGAKYLRGKGPLKLVYSQSIGDRSLAQRVEAKIRRLPRERKENLDRLPALIDRILAEFDGRQ
jgi:putative endonuclease